MLRKIGIYGVIAGLIVGVPMFATTVINSGHHHVPNGMVIGYLTMLVALSTIFVAIKRQRDQQGGVIKFWPALGLGLGISVVAGIFYVLTWEFSVAFTHMDFAADYSRAVLAEQKAKGASAAEMAKFVKAMDDFKQSYANPFYRLPMVFAEIFPVGVLVSLVSAALLCNSRFLPAKKV